MHWLREWVLALSIDTDGKFGQHLQNARAWSAWGKIEELIYEASRENCLTIVDCYT